MSGYNYGPFKGCDSIVLGKYFPIFKGCYKWNIYLAFSNMYCICIVLKCYPSTYCLVQGSYFICSNLKFEHFTSKLESQPLTLDSCY